MKIKAEDISYALNFLDDELIAECDKAREGSKVTSIPGKKAKITTIMPFIAAAAALLIIGRVVIAILPHLGAKSAAPQDSAMKVSNDAEIVATVAAAAEEAAEEPAEDWVTSLDIDSYVDSDDSNNSSDRTADATVYEADLGEEGFSLVPVNPGDGEIASEVHISYSALDGEVASVVSSLESREDIEEDYGRTLVSFFVEDVPYGEAVKYDLCEDSDGSSYVFVFEDDDGKRIVPANEDEYELLRQLIDEQAANSILYIYMSEE